MTTVLNAALAASVMVGMLSIPAVSQTATAGDTVQSDIPDVSTSELPESVTRTVSPDKFAASVETAFDSFQTSISSGQTNATLESSAAELKVRRSAESTKWVLTTPRGTLTVMQSPEESFEKVETARGTLTKTYVNGALKTEFSGSDRESVETTAEYLDNVLSNKRDKLEERRQQLQKSSTPDIEVVANESTAGGFGDNSKELVILVNNEDSSMSVEDWVLKNHEDEFALPDVEIGAGETVRVYTNSEDTVEEEGVYSSGLTWLNDGDEATLYNDQGVKVSESSY